MNSNQQLGYFFTLHLQITSFPCPKIKIWWEYGRAGSIQCPDQGWMLHPLFFWDGGANASLWHEMPHVVFGRVVILRHGFICNPTRAYADFSVHALWRGEYTAFYLKRKNKQIKTQCDKEVHRVGRLLIC